MFGDLYGLEDQAIPERDLWIWRIHGADQVFNFIWDTGVPEVTDPWPTLDPIDITDALSMLSPQTVQVLHADTQIMEVIQ